MHVARLLRRAAIAVLLAASCAAIACVLNPRPFLRAVGWALVSDQRVDSAEVIVLAAGADGAGVLEAADLVHRGVAPRVAVFPDPSDAVLREFTRRGVPYEDDASRSIRLLHELGVRTAELMPVAVVGTEDEGTILPGWCDRNRLHSLIVVTTKDHSRRVSRVLRRAMKDHQTRVSVCAAHYSKFDPDRWWQTRDGLRTGIVESEKLLLDIVRHPIS